jgi:hypothetical protein
MRAAGRRNMHVGMGMRRHLLRLDVILPERGPARWGIILWLVAGAAVALLVPVVLALMVAGLLGLE